MRWKREPPRREDPLLQDIARWIMRLDAKVDRVLDLLEDEDGQEEEDA
jgi:hypothetical protein